MSIANQIRDLQSIHMAPGGRLDLVRQKFTTYQRLHQQLNSIDPSTMRVHEEKFQALEANALASVNHRDIHALICAIGNTDDADRKTSKKRLEGHLASLHEEWRHRYRLGDVSELRLHPTKGRLCTLPELMGDGDLHFDFDTWDALHQFWEEQCIPVKNTALQILKLASRAAPVMAECECAALRKSLLAVQQRLASTQRQMAAAQQQELDSKDPTEARNRLEQFRKSREALLKEEQAAVKELLRFARACDYPVVVESCLQADRGMQEQDADIKKMARECTGKLQQLQKTESPFWQWVQQQTTKPGVDLTEQRLDPLTWMPCSILDLMRSAVISGSKTPEEVERFWQERCLPLSSHGAAPAPAGSRAAPEGSSHDLLPVLKHLQGTVDALTAKMEALSDAVANQKHAIEDVKRTVAGLSSGLRDVSAKPAFGPQLRASLAAAGLADSGEQTEAWCSNQGINSIEELLSRFKDFESFAFSDEGLDLKRSQVNALRKRFEETLAAATTCAPRPLEPEPEGGKGD